MKQIRVYSGENKTKDQLFFLGRSSNREFIFFLIDGDFCIDGKIDLDKFHSFLNAIQHSIQHNVTNISIREIGSKDNPGKVRIELGIRDVNKESTVLNWYVQMFFQEGNKVVKILASLEDLRNVK